MGMLRRLFQSFKFSDKPFFHRSLFQHVEKKANKIKVSENTF